MGTVAGCGAAAREPRVPTENSVRVEGRNLVSRGGQAFAAGVEAKVAASTWMLWRKLRNP